MPKNALLVSHQLDYSGAPVALFQLAKVLIQNGWSIDLYSLHGDGPIAKDFEAIGSRLIKNQPLEIQYQAYELVLFNTVVTTPLIPHLKPQNAKWILWIHESPYLAGFGWSPLVCFTNYQNINYLVFPSESCKDEWGGFINVNYAHVIQSPVDIPDQITELSINHQSIKKTFCIIDPRESYRNIEKIEAAILNYKEEAIFNFVGTTPPPADIKKKLDSIKSIEVNYFGRIENNRALEILANSDIYMSATSMATQNRGLCEALTMNKQIYLSKIKAHEEMGNACGLTKDSYFYPLEKINLDISLSPKNYATEVLSLNYFQNKWDSILKL